MISVETKKRLDELVKRYPEKRSALIPILHDVQAEVGYLSPEAIAWVAAYLTLSPADVMSVASFYDMLHLEPVGKHMIYVCQNLTCSLLGAERLIYTRLDSEPLIVRINEEQDSAPVIGARLHVMPQPERLHCFDEATGKRL